MDGYDLEDFEALKRTVKTWQGIADEIRRGEKPARILAPGGLYIMAHTVVPALLSEVEALKAENERLRAVLEAAQNHEQLLEKVALASMWLVEATGKLLPLTNASGDSDMGEYKTWHRLCAERHNNTFHAIQDLAKYNAQKQAITAAQQPTGAGVGEEG